MNTPLLPYDSAARLRDTAAEAQPPFFFSKWVTFACASLLMMSAGLPYAFSIYGEPLAEALDLSNAQLSLLGAFSNAGGYSAILAGLCYDTLISHKRSGPFLVALVGAACYAIGFSGLYAAAKSTSRVPMWLLAGLSYLSSNGGTWLEAAALITCVRNFETERGQVVGILKAFLGLSASLYTTLYVTFCKHRIDVLLLLASVPTIITIVASVGINLVPFRQFEPHSKAHAFHIAYNAVFSLAIYQLVSALYFNSHSDNAQADVGLIMCCAVLCLVMPVLQIPTVFGGFKATPLLEHFEKQKGIPAGATSMQQPVPEHPSVRLTPRTLELVRDGHDKGFHATEFQGKQGMTLFECLRSTDYWLLSVSVSTVTGCGLAFINSAGAIVDSLDGGEGQTSVIVSIFSVANCLGRMCTGFLPDLLQLPMRRAPLQVPRTHYLVLACIASTCCCSLDAFGDLTVMPLCALLTGFTFGFLQALSPTIVSEIFGLRYFATNYAMLSTLFIASSFGIANYLMSLNYSYFKDRDSDRCVGARCFRPAFLICAGISFVASCLSLILTSRQQKEYRSISKRVVRERRRRGTDAVRRWSDIKIKTMQSHTVSAASRIQNCLEHNGNLQSLHARIENFPGHKNQSDWVLEKKALLEGIQEQEEEMEAMLDSAFNALTTHADVDEYDAESCESGSPVAHLRLSSPISHFPPPPTIA